MKCEKYLQPYPYSNRISFVNCPLFLMDYRFIIQNQQVRRITFNFLYKFKYCILIFGCFTASNLGFTVTVNVERCTYGCVIFDNTGHSFWHYPILCCMRPRRQSAPRPSPAPAPRPAAQAIQGGGAVRPAPKQPAPPDVERYIKLTGLIKKVDFIDNEFSREFLTNLTT